MVEKNTKKYVFNLNIFWVYKILSKCYKISVRKEVVPRSKTYSMLIEHSLKCVYRNIIDNS